MEKALASISKLKQWASDSKIDLSNELSALELKVRNEFKKGNIKRDVLNTKNVSKKKATEQNGKISSKKSKNKNKNKENQIVSPRRLANTINFEISSKLVKGISHCHFCKVRRLECRQHTALNGSKILVCKDCRASKYRPHLSKKLKNKNHSEDIMDFVVSGSYGSGRKSR